MEFDEASWLRLEPAPGETLRAALERTLREAIAAGSLREGVQLPASRVLARTLGVSRGVVTDAYGQLEAQGLLTVGPRSAPVVAASLSQVSRLVRRREPRPPQPRFDLTPTTPDVTLFPLRDWLSTAQQAARRANFAVLDYRDSRGEHALRSALADHLGHTRGVIADPEQIIVVQGTAQGVDLLLRIFATRAFARVAVEDPSHTTQQERIRALGLELVGQPVDGDGLVIDALEADAVFVTPAHQFPTGNVLSGERRRNLIAWSQETGGVIVEDDYDSEFRYDREPVSALQGLAPDRVIHVGTVSKTLAPALRLGWVVVPDDLAEDAERVKRLVDDFSPALDQLTLAEFLTRGRYSRHLRHARAAYRARRDAVISALTRELPELSIEGIAAGVHLLLRLPEGVSDTEIAEQANLARIRVPPLSAFRIAKQGAGGLVIGYGRVHEAAVKSAARALAKVVRTSL
jgi:GntR family transcriptional regulator / MocR family aminotransferase